MNEEEILTEAARFGKDSIETMKELTPERPLGNEADLEEGSGMVSRWGLKFASMGTRYFPKEWFKVLEKEMGKTRAKKMEYEFGIASGVDINERFLVLGLGDVESAIACMSAAPYHGWGIAYVPHSEEVLGAIASAVVGAGKDTGMDEFVDALSQKLEKYEVSVEKMTDREARIKLLVYWINSFVAHSYLYESEKWEETKCDFLCGVAHGIVDIYTSAVIKEAEEAYGIKPPLYASAEGVKELSCKAQGKKFCTMELDIRVRRR